MATGDSDGGLARPWQRRRQLRASPANSGRLTGPRARALARTHAQAQERTRARARTRTRTHWGGGVVEERRLAGRCRAGQCRDAGTRSNRKSSPSKRHGLRGAAAIENRDAPVSGYAGTRKQMYTRTRARVRGRGWRIAESGGEGLADRDEIQAKAKHRCRSTQ